ncbi:MAG TPA: hypothetical protein VJ934_11110 [Desulfomicrobiaceae bacterium]|nr:hypothetical protein [Desulfomicrobiaceae bacterium]
MLNLIFQLPVYARSVARIAVAATRRSKRTFVRRDKGIDPSMRENVLTWQKKQLHSMTFENVGPAKSSDGKIDLARMWRIHRSSLQAVRHDLDGMWQVSTDTLEKGRGISLDQSIVIMHRLRDAGFPDESLGVVSVQMGSRRHSFAVVQDREDDFWMLDNGYFSNIPVRASAYLAKKSGIVYLIGFNFFDVWTY